MTETTLIENILKNNGGPSRWTGFDDFWDNMISHSYFVVEGPAPIPPTDEELEHRKEDVRLAIAKKYWT
jgi:hypothetical protein